MEIIQKNNFREIVATEGKYVHRINSDSYFTRGVILPIDTLENFEEVDSVPSPNDELTIVKQQIIDAITAYDTSEAVNSFFLDGEQVWLDKDTRVGLMNSTNIQKAAGQLTATLWFGGKSYTIPCDTAIQMLSALELYALQCYNVTAQHKAAVEAYDYKTGYPDKLNLNTKTL